VARAETDEEVLHRAAVHSKSVHYIEVTKEVDNTARKLKHEE
jgi:predicted small metal-binding protein